jgi:hypothetical protein
MTVYKDIRRKITLYTLICIYSFALIRPAMPLVNDAVAHIFFKMEHLATVHFENGKYHIHAELQKASENTNSKNNTTSSIFETLASHLKNESARFIIYRTRISEITFPYINIPVDISLKFPTPPPKA